MLIHLADQISFDGGILRVEMGHIHAQEEYLCHHLVCEDAAGIHLSE